MSEGVWFGESGSEEERGVSRAVEAAEAVEAVLKALSNDKRNESIIKPPELQGNRSMAISSGVSMYGSRVVCLLFLHCGRQPAGITPPRSCQAVTSKFDIHLRDVRSALRAVNPLVQQHCRVPLLSLHHCV